MATHFTQRSLLGTKKADTLFAKSRKGERLYGGKGDDILISRGGATHTHGGSGADTFAFMFNTKASKKRCEMSNPARHVIHDFNPEEGDKIDLTHILNETNNNEIKFRQNKIRGEGVEVRFIPGQEKVVPASKKGFKGIEDGVAKELGELPLVTHKKNRELGSKYEVFIDGKVHHEIILKHIPGKANAPLAKEDNPEKMVPKRITKSAKFREIDTKSSNKGRGYLGFKDSPQHKVIETPAEAAIFNQEEQDWYDENKTISITPKGIPFYGNAAKLDIEPLVNVYGGLEHWNYPEVHLGGQKEFPFFHVDISFYLDFYLGLNIGPKFTLYTGSIPGEGTWPSFSEGATESLDFDPPFDIRASGGVSIDATVNVTEQGLNKSISGQATFGPEIDFSLSQDGPMNSASTKQKLQPLTVAGGNNEETFDSLEGVDAKISIAPFAQFDVGIGVSGDGWHADLVDGGPKMSSPLSIQINEEGAGIGFDPFKLDFVVRVIDVSFEKFSLSGYSKSFSLFDAYDVDFLSFPEICAAEITGTNC